MELEVLRNQSIKCQVLNCKNRSDEGHGVFLQNLEDKRVIFVCSPCWVTVMTKSLCIHSQLYRNISAHNAKEK